ncbi:MAG: ABC transporter ATP-binding protein/permease [Erysipelotrichaceae bacterium]|nr:ABC transporter ATP-binding protein/permease [Erysipelotrichaceae bacterium]
MKKIIEKQIKSSALLKLVDIKKDYVVNGNNEPVHALKGVNINFRKSEFVSILGPSGCGKTTLLNIIGGLDKYTSGDLIISSKSTKYFKDRDWDIYRNHRIGFIFQSYNLIPHQTILENVELALTIAGINKKERIEKSKKALDKVGLKDLYNKHPNQLSGGQCQRVAIARALVNEPEILLADEPTGALDTITSKQIMDLIQEISKEKLVIMVTHNPEIAREYSSRIIRLLDGNIQDDSNPFDDNLEINESNEVDIISKEKAKMSFATAFKLSARNLYSKLKRTILVCVAGSIGIVGVSTVLAISSGVHKYIESMQDDMLSGNPIEITEKSYDIAGLMTNSTTLQKIEILQENGWVNVNSIVEYLVGNANTINNYQINNEIKEEYINYVKAMPKENYSAMSFDYGIDIAYNFYTDWYNTNADRNANNSRDMSIGGITKMYTSVLEDTKFKDYSSYIAQLSTAITQAPNNADYILSQYDILAGDIATNENQIMVVVNKDRQLTDIILAQLGYFTQEEFLNIIYKATDENEKYDETINTDRIDYNRILNKKFVYYDNDTIFERNTTPILQDYNTFKYSPYVSENWNDGYELEVVGILQPKENISYGCLHAGFYYNEAFTKKYLNDNYNSNIIKFYRDDRKMNTITSGPSINSSSGMNVDLGVTFTYDYYNGDGELKTNQKGYLGTQSGDSIFLSFIQSMLPGASGNNNSEIYSISIRQLGGNNIANNIKIYPINFDTKYKVTNYLDEWNDHDITITVDGINYTYDQRNEIKYNDNLELVINMINTMIDIITYALIVFTALSLLVSTVMIGIITYVSVVERVKEIGVIRSLGGRKKDVSYLFNAETFIIGLASGVFGILITICLSGIINLIVGNLSGIYTIASLKVTDAIIMILISILLTLISGLIPSKAAANKNPVDALRSE